MDVFHYVADQLKDESLFDSPPLQSFNSSGSIYNDFDRSSVDLLETSSQLLFCYSQTTNFDDNQDSDDDTILQEAVDHAIMQEDRNNGVYNPVVWDTPLFDNFGSVNAIEYMSKVNELATNHDVWDDLTFTKDCIDMFERRERTNWEGPDTVYDAWLLRKGSERPTFDYFTFHLRHPECDDILNDLHSRKKRRIQSEQTDETDDSKIVFPDAPNDLPSTPIDPPSTQKDPCPTTQKDTPNTPKDPPEKSSDLSQAQSDNPDGPSDTPAGQTDSLDTPFPDAPNEDLVKTAATSNAEVTTIETLDAISEIVNAVSKESEAIPEESNDIPAESNAIPDISKTTVTTPDEPNNEELIDFSKESSHVIKENL